MSSFSSSKDKSHSPSCFLSSSYSFQNQSDSERPTNLTLEAVMLPGKGIHVLDYLGLYSWRVLKPSNCALQGRHVCRGCWTDFHFGCWAASSLKLQGTRVFLGDWAVFLPVSLFHLACFIDDEFEIDFVKQTFISKSKS